MDINHGNFELEMTDYEGKVAKSASMLDLVDNKPNVDLFDTIEAHSGSASHSSFRSHFSFQPKRNYQYFIKYDKMM